MIFLKQEHMSNNQIYLVFELLNGKSLKAIIRSKKESIMNEN